MCAKLLSIKVAQKLGLFYKSLKYAKKRSTKKVDITKWPSFFRRLEEEALYQSIKEARLIAQKAEEERLKQEEEERRRLIELKVKDCLVLLDKTASTKVIN